MGKREDNLKITMFCHSVISSGTTIIGHNRNDKGLVRDTTNVSIPVEYEASSDQIAALVSISSQCQQSLQYECIGSALWNTSSVADNYPFYDHIGWWKSSASGPNRYNFGGNAAGLMGCPCSFDNSKDSCFVLFFVFEILDNVANIDLIRNDRYFVIFLFCLFVSFSILFVFLFELFSSLTKVFRYVMCTNHILIWQLSTKCVIRL